ncbi:hypothetical protein EF83_21575 [Bacillus subtilis]|nr:hypothetical protein EF83_21575 [Bacillus subtilis]
MELIFTETIKRDQKLENTDIVKLSDDYYMVVKEFEGYIARKFKGWTGATGHHPTFKISFRFFIWAQMGSQNFQP